MILQYNLEAFPKRNPLADATSANRECNLYLTLIIQLAELRNHAPQRALFYDLEGFYPELHSG